MLSSKISRTIASRTCSLHAELVAVFHVDLGIAAFRALLGRLAFLSSADLLAVHLRAVEAAEVAQPRGGRVHFDEEMMAGDEGVVARQAGVAGGRATEDEGVVLVEDEGFAFHYPVGELEVNFAGHGWRV